MRRRTAHQYIKKNKEGTRNPEYYRTVGL